MQGLITVDDLRELFAIDKDLKDERFERALSAGSRRLRDWVGDAAYDDAVSIPPEDQQRAEDLAFAEAHLVMGLSLLGVNTSMRSTGIVSSERVEGQVTISYLKPDELMKLQQQYLDQAEQIARPYLKSDGTPEAMGVITAGNDCLEAVTREC